MSIQERWFADFDILCVFLTNGVLFGLFECYYDLFDIRNLKTIIVYFLLLELCHYSERITADRRSG